MARLIPIAALGVALVLGSAPPASAAPEALLGYSETGQPTSFELKGLDYAVEGYRSAKWGMTPAQVRGAASRDFPGAKIGTEVVDPVMRTTILVVAVPSLAPGPGPMAVSYVFGATTGRLIHVNLDWQDASPTPARRAEMTAAASQIVGEFMSYYWKIGEVARGVAVGPNALVLFAAAGTNGGAVEVRLQGVSYALKTPNGDIPSPPPAGQVLLHVGFARTDGQPDVFAIKPGEF